MKPKKLVQDEYKDIMSSLDQDLTEEDIEKLIEIETEKYKDPIVNFLKEINLRKSDDLECDFIEARNILTGSIDRVEKISEIAFGNLLVQKDNPMFMDMVIKIQNLQSQNVKNLLDLHSKANTVLQQQKKNNSDEGKKDSNKPSLFVATKK